MWSRAARRVAEVRDAWDEDEGQVGADPHGREGRRTERKPNWLLIKEHDEFERPQERTARDGG